MAPVGTKERIIEASAELFRRQGYAGTGIKSIAETASAPFGSLYHFFPGGKEELADAVIRRSGEFYLRLFESIVDASPDVVTGIRNFFLGAAETLRATDYADACPIATVALEVASTNEPLRQATADVFETWLAALSSRLASAGIPESRARDLAIEAVAALEGAFILSRAARSATAVEVVGRAMVESVRAALATHP
ncbi:MAG: TetR/AcrR family transcriptional regulator [Dehalococcoidia bacterium]